MPANKAREHKEWIEPIFRNEEDITALRKACEKRLAQLAAIVARKRAVASSDEEELDEIAMVKCIDGEAKVELARQARLERARQCAQRPREERPSSKESAKTPERRMRQPKQNGAASSSGDRGGDGWQPS